MKINNEKYEKYLADLDKALKNEELTEHEAWLDYMLYGDEDNND